MKLKTVEVLELARPNRAGAIDVVDSDGNVVPLDYLGEDFVPDANSSIVMKILRREIEL